jgi:hypothetical protein
VNDEHTLKTKAQMNFSISVENQILQKSSHDRPRSKIIISETYAHISTKYPAFLQSFIALQTAENDAPVIKLKQHGPGKVETNANFSKV